MALRALVFTLVSGAIVACGHVAPYEREDLARSTMNPTREEHEGAFAAHLHDSREGATGGTGSTGAGCGCN